MTDIPNIIISLKQTPQIFEQFIGAVPIGELKERRLINQWSAQEWAAHLVKAQIILLDRFQAFMDKGNPEFEPHFIDQTEVDPQLMEYGIVEMCSDFKAFRKGLIDLVSARDSSFWVLPGIHKEYSQYNPYILLRHVLMVDHFHLFQIERLWLTQDKFL